MTWQDAASALCNEIIWFQLTGVEHPLYCRITRWMSCPTPTQAAVPFRKVCLYLWQGFGAGLGWVF